MFTLYILPFLASFLLSVFLTLGVKRIALYFKIVDQPGERKIHKSEIPLLGGMAIFLSFFAILFLYSDRFLAGNLEWHHLLGFFSGALLIIIGGFLDDKYNLPAKWQIVFPILAIVAVVIGGVEIEKITNPLGGFIYLKDLIIVGPALIALWLLGMMYTTKLLDGVDGLVSGIGAIGALVIFLFTLTTKYFQPDIALAAAILMGAAGGFLVFNFYPAKIFLGEGGSLFFGYILGVLAIISGGKIAIALLIMGIPILDVAWTIMRRIFQGKNPFRFADNKHLHHRLLRLGLNQRQTVLVFYFFSLIFGLSSLFLQSRGKLLVLLLLLLIMLTIVIIFQFLDKPSENAKPSLLLHICCAPCATYISSVRLLSRFRLTWFFHNPNLVSQEEYDKRLKYVKLMATKFSIPLIVAPYEHKAWCELVKGRELDPERGVRCRLCYSDRLRATVKLARSKKFDFFATSLSLSPYKDKEAIAAISKKLAIEIGVKFLDEDFQTDNAYYKSQELAKELGMYRQKFCGCEYSIKKDKND